MTDQQQQLCLMPHTAEQLSPCTTTTEAQHPKAHALQQKKPPQWEVQMPQLESSPLALQLEKALLQQERPSTAKNKYVLIKKIGGAKYFMKE